MTRMIKQVNTGIKETINLRIRAAKDVHIRFPPNLILRKDNLS